MTINPADDQAGLGRDVVATGNVGPGGYACYTVGWHVQNAQGWTGYFIKTEVTPAADGSFRTSMLQMGADAETTSSWQPFVLGSTRTGCTLLNQLWAQTPTGEYHDAFPPAGSKLLYYSPTPIHRTR